MLRPCLLVLFVSGCVVHSTSKQTTPGWTRQLGRKGGEVQLISQDGHATPWLSASQLQVLGDHVCLKPEGRAWRDISALRISSLTDDNIATILAGLPRDIHVRHLGGGSVYLQTDGRDLGAWVRARAHDTTDTEARYVIHAWSWSSRPLTWSQLARWSRPVLGWPVLGTTAQFRKVDMPTTIALNVALVPVMIVAVGVAAVAQIPLPGQRTSDRTQSIRVEGRPIRIADEPDDGNWGATVCDLDARGS